MTHIMTLVKPGASAVLMVLVEAAEKQMDQGPATVPLSATVEFFGCPRYSL